MKVLKIGARRIGSREPVYIVAEVSGNHNQSKDRAVQIVEEACRAGVDAIKLQTYTPDTLTIDCDSKWFRVKGTNAEWRGKTLYELYQSAYTPWEWHAELQRTAARHGVGFFSTPFDTTAVDFLETLKVPAYKVASFEIGDLELLRKIGSTGKPVILSRGMATLDDVRRAIKTLRGSGAGPVAVLHCVSSYPAKPDEMNLATIPALGKKLRCVVGLSDHTLGIEVAVASVSLGASVIEKHVTLRRADGGPDAAFSLEPAELRELVRAVRNVEQAIGTPQYRVGRRESANLVFRRSLFVVQNVRKGERFTTATVRSIRPGYGIAPRFLGKVLGRKAARDLKRGTPLSWEVVGETSTLGTVPSLEDRIK
jgi:N-acetylneuraminate synthase